MFKKGFFLGPLFPAAVIGSYSRIFLVFEARESLARPLAIITPPFVVLNLALTE
jgi:hypothetical protein